VAEQGIFIPAWIVSSVLGDKVRLNKGVKTIRE